MAFQIALATFTGTSSLFPGTLTFTVAVRSTLKFVGSILSIDISKQNSSHQLFEFQTEERIFPSWCRTNINKPLCYHRRDLRRLQYSTRTHLPQQHHFLSTIQKLRLTFPCQKLSQKNSHEGSSDERQKLPSTRSI